jgi:membrane protein YdbS with pleckstrin-like domain
LAFFLQRASGLVFLFFFISLPFLISFGVFNYQDEVIRRDYPRYNQIERESYKPTIFKVFSLIPVGFTVLTVFFVVIIFIWSRLYYNSYKFEISKKGLKIEKGVIWKHYITIPYDRIQNVDILRGAFDRLLGLSDLQVQTAGYSGAVLTEGRLQGLLPGDAEKLRDELVDKIGKNQGL